MIWENRGGFPFPAASAILRRLKPGDPAEDAAMAMIQDEVKQRLGKLAARMDDMRGYL
jgi:hypothetical protein